MRIKLGKVIASVLAIVMAVGVMYTGAVSSSAATNKKTDYSKFTSFDGYNMTYEEIVEWAKSRSNGKSETQNDNTSAEFTNYYIEQTEDKTSITLCVWQKDKVNSGIMTALRMGQASDNAMNDTARSFDDAFNELVKYGVLKNSAKDNKYVKKVNNFSQTVMQLDAAIKAYTANRIKMYFVFDKDSKGKVYLDSKPSLVCQTMLYDNHERDLKENNIYTLKSNAKVFTKTNKPVYNHFQTLTYYDSGLWYWLTVVDPINYEK